MDAIAESNDLIKAYGYKFGNATNPFDYDDPDDAPRVIVTPDGRYYVSRAQALREIETGEWKQYYRNLWASENFERIWKANRAAELDHQSAVVDVIQTASRYVEVLLIYPWNPGNDTPHSYVFEVEHKLEFDPKGRPLRMAVPNPRSWMNGYLVNFKRVLKYNFTDETFDILLQEVEMPHGTVAIVRFGPPMGLSGIPRRVVLADE